MVTQMKTHSQPRPREALAAMHMPLMNKAWLEVMPPADRKRGQSRWAVGQVLAIAESERITGRRIDFVMSDWELPHMVLWNLCPEWTLLDESCTSEAGNQQVTQSMPRVLFAHCDPMVLDYTDAGIDPECLDVTEVCGRGNDGVRVVARLVATEVVNGRLLVSYEYEGQVGQ